MALEDILINIKEDARKEAQDIIDSARRERDKILKEAENEAEGLREEIVKSALSEEEFLFQKEIISKRLTDKKELDWAKKSQIDGCFKEALEELCNLDDNLYKTLIKKMLGQIEVKEESEIIFSSNDRSRITGDHINRLNPRLKLLFSDDVKGGFILKTRFLTFDNSLANLLASLRVDLEPKVAEILFGVI